MSFQRLICMALVTAVVMSLSANGQLAAQENANGDIVTVEVVSGAKLRIDSLVSDILAGAPLSIRSYGRATTLETDMIGYQRLLADERLSSVRLLSSPRR